MSTALEWFKSSYSSEQGGACLEVAYAWRKSTHSHDEGGACVEIAACPTAVHVRDSKVPDGPSLTLTPATWSHFARYAGASHGG
ncbi:DUF397 domain-containing protein [Streptomyces agglomeratus]|uniref:DUF397 domain-containing protein n=1 Tax=Streptomyces agglomeratus TaxID=285458 RepID=A0A1E5P841_9ACTN|nr:DUF397 domain-containing protein [Streptomyces agglomeratus]OEJ25675.1 DUF397 domain-containing protein [Streptomyces agglomeratus]OEJ52836.1 DUF397 domain-containing protein [Streptomyces agglomeratus]OEJ60172.1 DUF397 domain-containing protein [Streptomyces agglomeratus]